MEVHFLLEALFPPFDPVLFLDEVFFLALLLGVAAFCGVAWADPAACCGAAAWVEADADFFVDLFAFLAPPFFFPILFDPAAFFVLLAPDFFPAGLALATKMS